MKDKLRDLILKYSDVFSHGPFDIGAFPPEIYQHKLVLRNEKDSVYVKQFRIQECYRAQMEQHIRELLKMNIIRHSQSAFNAPAFAILKRDKRSLRICVDYRRLNQATVPQYHPGATVAECFDSIARLKADTYSLVDVTSGFYHIFLSEQSRKLTAFTVPGLGRFEFNRVPFGLLSGPSSFWTVIQEITRGLPCALSYLDDVMTATMGKERHLAELTALLERFRQFNMRLNLKKCAFFQSTVTYLGYQLDKDGSRPADDKVKAIRDAPEPKTVRDVQSFLGLTNYYRKYVHRYAFISQHLSKLTSKKHPWKSGPLPPESKRAFDQLKLALISKPICRHVDFQNDFVLYSDASTGTVSPDPDTGYTTTGGLGAALSQICRFTKEQYFVGYASRGLKQAERAYGAYLLEMAAACFAIDSFDCWLKGRPFKLVVDHKPLVRLEGSQTKTFLRLQQLLNEYMFEIEWQAGSSNSVCDWLSRNISSVTLAEGSYIDVYGYSAKEMYTMQSSDPILRTLREFLLTKQLPHDADQRRIIKHYAARTFIGQHDLILYLVQDFDKKLLPVLFIPKCAQQDYLRAAHSAKLSGGHAGQEVCIKRLRTMCFWEGMANDVGQFIKSCDVCQRGRRVEKHQPTPLAPIPPSTTPNFRVHIDLIGPMTGDAYYRYICVISDSFTRWTEFVCLPNKESLTVAKAFHDRWLCRFSTPTILVSDCGKEFTADVIQHLLHMIGLEHRTTSPGNPKADGAAEICNKQAARFLRSFCESAGHQWSEWVPALQFNFNTSQNKAIKMSPFRALYGFQPRLGYFDDDALGELFYGEKEGYDLHQRIEIARKHALENSLSFRDSYTFNFNKSLILPDYKKNSLVLLHDPARSLREHRTLSKPNAKLTPPWVGPFTVLTVKPDVRNLVIKRLSNGKVERVHFDRVKPYRLPQPLEGARGQDLKTSNNLHKLHNADDQQRSKPVYSDSEEMQDLPFIRPGEVHEAPSPDGDDGELPQDDHALDTDVKKQEAPSAAQSPVHPEPEIQHFLEPHDTSTQPSAPPPTPPAQEAGSKNKKSPFKRLYDSFRQRATRARGLEPLTEEEHRGAEFVDHHDRRVRSDKGKPRPRK